MQNLNQGAIFHEKYELITLLGIGGFAEVWKARYLQTDELVALKIFIRLDAEGIEEAKQEFKTSIGLSHSHIIKVRHFDIWEGQPYLVMVLYDKGNTIKLINKVTEEQIAILIYHVSQALDYLHSQELPIIHRDIKPDNILIDKQDEYHLSDLGISQKLRRTMTRSVAANRQTVSSNQTGSTPMAYYAPEMFNKESGSKTPIKAHDMFALGVTLFELTSGDLPFGELGGVLLNQSVEIPDIPSNYSEGLNKLVASCLAKEPWDRPTARQLSEKAGHYLATGQWSEFSLEETPSSTKSKKPLVLVLSILLLLVLGGVGGYFYLQHQKQEEYKSYMAAGERLLQEAYFIEALQSFNKAGAINNTLEFEEKVKVCEDSISTGFDVNFALGKENLNDNNIVQSVLSFKNALQYKPNNSEVLTLLDSLNIEIESLYSNSIEKAQIYLSEQKYEASREAIGNALALKPDTGQALTLQSKIDQAIDSCYLENMNKGDTSYGSEDYSSALTHYKQALVCIPNDETATSKITNINRVYRKYNQPYIRKKPRNMKLLSVELTEKNTIVTMKITNLSSFSSLSLYGPSNEKYAFYIRDNKQKIYKLKSVRGWRFGENQKLQGKTKTFKLLFEKLPLNTKTIDLFEGKEQLNETMTYWNFRGVQLK